MTDPRDVTEDGSRLSFTCKEGCGKVEFLWYGGNDDDTAATARAEAREAHDRFFHPVT